MVVSDSASRRISGNDQELPHYWSNASPSSPAHVLQTPPHAFFAVLGISGLGCFSWALVQQRRFDAGIAGLIALLCVYVYSLQSERCRLKSEWREGWVSRESDSSGKEAAGGVPSELDLTSYGRALGVSIRDGIVHKEGSTVNKLLMDALAKEYLRCTAALRCYQNAFGPLQEDLPEHDDQSASQNQTTETTRTISLQPVRPCPISTSLNLATDLAAGLAESPKRSRADLAESPKRSRVGNELLVPALDLSVTLNFCHPSMGPVGTPSTIGPAHNEGSPVHTANVASQPQVKSGESRPSLAQACLDNMQLEREVAQDAAEASFGLFGR